MINHKEAEILAYLMKRSPSNTYVVVEPDEIIGAMTEKIEKDELLSLLTDLSGREAILSRIINLNECVVAPTPKAPVLIDELKEMEEAKNMINTVKTVVNPVPTVENTDNTTKSKKKFFKTRKTQQPQVPQQVVTTKVEIDTKKVFRAAFSGALCGAGIIAIIMLIIGLVL